MESMMKIKHLSKKRNSYTMSVETYRYAPKKTPPPSHKNRMVGDEES